MPPDPNVFAECTWCLAPIAYGSSCLSISRNVQRFNSDLTELEVLESDLVLCLCQECAEALPADVCEEALSAYTPKAPILRVISSNNKGLSAEGLADRPMINCSWCQTSIYGHMTHVAVERSIGQCEFDVDNGYDAMTITESQELLSLCVRCGAKMTVDALEKTLGEKRPE